jgi:hypothetical protein
VTGVLSCKSKQCSAGVLSWLQVGGHQRPVGERCAVRCAVHALRYPAKAESKHKLSHSCWSTLSASELTSSSAGRAEQHKQQQWQHSSWCHPTAARSSHWLQELPRSAPIYRLQARTGRQTQKARVGRPDGVDCMVPQHTKQTQLALCSLCAQAQTCSSAGWSGGCQPVLTAALSQIQLLQVTGTSQSSARWAAHVSTLMETKQKPVFMLYGE